MKYHLGDVWYAHFPLEEDNTLYIDRPVIVVIAETPEIVIVKITKTAPRNNDQYDVQIQHYLEAGLRYPSTARVSKIITVDESQILRKIGSLHPDDLEIIVKQLIEFTSQ